ncbi:MAG: polyphosphate polymerase domain-containing protein [Planctomycetes bacterium]|nr:polyphosphate polymerase domain-containing protein [Planctomycetota bacterium]
MNATETSGGYVRTFNRFEFKYVVSERQAEALIRDLEPYTTPDPHSPTDRGYPVYSVYWDSPDLVFFWEKIDGQKFRRKLRFRLYEGSDDAFVEIKQRIDQTVQKRRTRMARTAIHELFGRGPIDAGREHGVTDPVVQEALILCRRHLLEPKLAVSYRRRAFFARYEHDLRITFDTRLQYDARALDVRERFETGKYLLPADRAVLEIKFNGNVPLWLTKLVGKHELLSRRFSKYARSADLEFFDGRHT